MNFCSQCGASVALRIPDGDNLPRHVCERCGTIHYSNPKLVVGCVAEWDGHILLCKRAIEPRLGYWTIPAGFMENEETAEQAASRETAEEACAEVNIIEPVALYSLPRISQVYLIYRAEMTGPDHLPGAESLATELVHPGDIPWDELAFPVIREVLKHYLADRESGAFPMRTGVLTRRLG